MDQERTGLAQEGLKPGIQDGTVLPKGDHLVGVAAVESQGGSSPGEGPHRQDGLVPVSQGPRGRGAERHRRIRDSPQASERLSDEPFLGLKL